MDELKKCALSFNSLLDKEYYIKAGKKQKLLEIHLYFDKIHFHHLIGLNKLEDRRQVSKFTPQLYDNILNDKLTHNQIVHSDFYSEIAERLEYFPLLEQILDSEEVMVKHNWSRAKSTIKATAIIYSKIDDKYIHFFIDTDTNSGRSFGRTFFVRRDRLYLYERPYKIIEKIKYKNGTILTL